MKTYKIKRKFVNIFLDILNDYNCDYKFEENDDDCDVFEGKYYVVNVYDNIDNIEKDVNFNECLF